MQIELSNLVHTQTTALSDAWAGTSWFELTTALGDVLSTLIVGTSMMLFIFSVWSSSTPSRTPK